MAYTATKYLSVRPNFYPRGHDNTQRRIVLNGLFVENDTSTMYSTGGIGSTSFEVTAFSAVGLVTYSALVGAPLVNGLRVVVFNTASNTNDGTYIVSALTATNSTSGTFVAVPLPGNTLAASAQTAQTAEGVGQIQWGIRSPITQTFTATAVTVSGAIMTVTYTTLVGPQLYPADSVTLAAMTNAGNNGTFTLNTIKTTSATAGSFTVTNGSAVASDSGTGTGSFLAGTTIEGLNQPPNAPVLIQSVKGWLYFWDSVNYTVRIFGTGASSGAVLAEASLGAGVTFDGNIMFKAEFIRDGIY